jgi:PD-(D/E)XK endonuclease
MEPAGLEPAIFCCVNLGTKSSHPSHSDDLASASVLAGRAAMASLKTKGDLAELKVATDLVRRGYCIAIPFGEDHDFDLILCRDGNLERVQVKYTESNGKFVIVRTRSHSLTNGRVKRTKRYTAEMIEWIAVYDRTTDRCYYVPSSELGNGRSDFHLRLTEPLNCQKVGIRYAGDYLDPVITRPTMEPAGFEPATSCLQGRRSPN